MNSKTEYQNSKKKAKDALILNKVRPDAFKQNGSRVKPDKVRLSVWIPNCYV